MKDGYSFRRFNKGLIPDCNDCMCEHIKVVNTCTIMLLHPHESGLGTVSEKQLNRNHWHYA